MAVTFDAKPALSALEYIALNMRDADAREIYNLAPFDDPFSLARYCGHLLDLGHFGFVAKLNDVPVAVFGWVELRPGVMDAWGFGTNRFQAVSTSLTKFAIRHLRPTLLQSGVHRLQCDSRYDHEEAHRWLLSMGFRIESTMEGFGKDRSTYHRFYALREWFNVLSKDAEAGEAASAS